MLTKKCFILFLVFIGFIFTSCKLINPVVDYTKKISLANADKFSINSFPLSVGNHWKYKAEYRIDTDVSEGTVIRTITETINIYGVGCHVIEDKFYIGENEYTDINYWAQVGNELLWYGHGTSAGESPWLPSNFSVQNGTKNLFKNRTFHSLGDVFNITTKTEIDSNPNTQYFYNPPRKLLDFPLIPGKVWYNEIPDAPGISITRKVICQETITVPAGTFLCAKVQYIIISDIDVFMWYSSIGLVKSYIYSSMEGWDEYGEPAEDFEIYEIYELQSYTLNSEPQS